MKWFVTSACIFFGFTIFVNRCEALASCLSELDKCNNNERCKEAIEGIDLKCKITEGKCSSPMRDITRCGRMMDHLFMDGFRKEKCECSENSQECLKIQQKVYENPCFVDAYDKVNTREPVKAFVSTRTALSQKLKKITEKEQNAPKRQQILTTQSESMDIEATPSTPSPHPSNEDSKVPRKIQSLEKSGSDRKTYLKLIETSTHQILTKPSRVLRSRKSVMVNKGRFKSSTMRNRIAEVNTGKLLKQISSRMEQSEPQKIVSDTDYKSIAIILGILLSIFVVSSLIIFLWTRTSNLIMYKGVKFIQDHRNTDEVLSRIQAQFPGSPTQKKHHV